MYARCSESTQTHRFHGLLRELPSAYLAEVLTQPAGVHDGVVAELCSLPSTPHPPHMIALASLHTSEENGNATGEIGLLVEDAWQRRGLGRLLLSSLVSRAHARGLRRVQADILNQDWRLRSALARTLPTIKAAASRSSTTTVFEIGTELSAARTLPMCLLLADRGRQSEVPLTRSEW